MLNVWIDGVAYTVSLGFSTDHKQWTVSIPDLKMVGNGYTIQAAINNAMRSQGVHIEGE